MATRAGVVRLVGAAKDAMQNAYAPYSKFRVGAALRSAAGQVYSGCNVENVSFSIGVCAERNAIAAAVRSEGPAFSLEIIAVAASSSTGKLVELTPCGACRQAIMEFGKLAEVALIDSSGEARILSINELLPHPFVFEQA